ncbi:MAG: hypothetical protein JJU02_16915 [Cryomorphaceae bacterium]|nr:hypothetical protein [Cryomorphaceae bacterium]
MKQFFIFSTALFFAVTSFAQQGESLINYTAPGDLNHKKHIKIDNKKSAKKCKRVAIAKSALHFKVISNGKAIVGKGMSEREGSTSWAILEGISEALMQELADAYYDMLSDKLKAKGFEVVPWESVKNSKAITKLSDNEREWSSKSTGAAQIFTAHNGPHTKPIMGNIGTWRQFGKMAKELDAFPLFTDLIIDFAVFDMNLHRKRGYKYKTTTATTNVLPEISIQPYYSGEILPMGYSPTQSTMTLVEAYGKASTILINRNVSFEGNIAEEIDSYSGKMPKQMSRWVSFGSNLTTGTFVVKADPEMFKAAVLNALDQYSDILISKWMEVRS